MGSGAVPFPSHQICKMDPIIRKVQAWYILIHIIIQNDWRGEEMYIVGWLKVTEWLQSGSVEGLTTERWDRSFSSKLVDQPLVPWLQDRRRHMGGGMHKTISPFYTKRRDLLGETTVSKYHLGEGRVHRLNLAPLNPIEQPLHSYQTCFKCVTSSVTAWRCWTRTSPACRARCCRDHRSTSQHL